ncbi:nitroreductase [Candidatus Bathyarchaeota archaeon]|nr:MAG: nitroreductase [Candidatus Bathyarchaeota archaeon]
MDAYECIATKLDVREFGPKKVPAEVKLKVLEAARLTGSGVNRQHWKFILVQDKDNIRTLAADSTSGSWVGKADFAVIVLTDPKLGFAKIDAGRATQDMQLAAWNYGVVSGIYTGIAHERLRNDFAIPLTLEPTLVVGFGYPTRTTTGKKKNRKPLSEVAYLEKFGNAIDPKKLG